MTDKQMIDKLKNDVACKENIINHLAEHNIKLQEQLKIKEQELKRICKAFDIEYIIDKETNELYGRCNKLYKKEQECESLKQVLSEIKEHFDEECKLCKANYVNITDEICEECESKYMLQLIKEVNIGN